MTYHFSNHNVLLNDIIESLFEDPKEEFEEKDVGNRAESFERCE